MGVEPLRPLGFVRALCRMRPPPLAGSVMCAMQRPCSKAAMRYASLSTSPVFSAGWGASMMAAVLLSERGSITKVCRM